jgi:hypothetical protein
MFSDWGTILPKLSIIDPKPDVSYSHIRMRADSLSLEKLFLELIVQIDTLG